MSLLTMLSLAIAAVLAAWALETFLLQPLRYRRAAARASTLDANGIAAACSLFADSPLARLLSNMAGVAMLLFLVAVVILRMDVDFSLVLVLATLGSGLFWLLETLLLRRQRQQAVDQLSRNLGERGISSELQAKQPLLVEYSVSFFPVLAAVLVVRSFLAEPFTIPSGSMLPTLEIGDYILVSKFSYGLRVPVLGTKFLAVGEPQRGDVIVFRYPVNPSENFIKRLVGLPGDHIVVDGSKVYVNGTLVPTTLDHQDPEVDPWQMYFHEQLGTHSHITRQLVGVDGNRPDMIYTDVVVPPGQYFMMGDNRNESDDSRFWGFVPDNNIVGKAFCIWIHKEPGLHLPSFGRDGIVN